MSALRNPLVLLVGLLSLWSIGAFGVIASERGGAEAHVREMLSKAWSEPSSGQKLAEEQFKAGLEADPGDPRLYQAYGLVLLKHLRYGDAQNQFAAAVDQSKNSDLPSWRLLIHLRVRRGEREAALVDLSAWMHAVVERKAEPDSLEARLKDEYVAWAGRMIGYLEKPAGLKRLEAQVKELDQEITGLLDDGQREMYDAAKAEVFKLYAEITELSDRRRVVAKKEEQQKKQHRESEIKEEKLQIAKDQDKLEMSAEQWQQWIDQQLPDFDRQLVALESEFGRLQREAFPIRQSIAEIEREIADLWARRDQALRDGNPKGNTPPKTNEPKVTSTPAPNPSEPKQPEPKPKDKEKGKEKEKPKSKSPYTKEPTDRASIESIPGASQAALFSALVTGLTLAPATGDRELAVLYQQSIDRLTFDLGILRRDYVELDQRATEVRASFADVLNRRQTAVARYQRATGKLIKESDEMKARKKRLGAEAKVVSQPATGKTTKDTNMIASAASLTRYVNVNLEQEKQRLLDSSGTP